MWNPVASEPFQPFPESVEIDGEQFPVNSDFRFFVALETEIHANSEPDVAMMLFQFYLGNIPHNIEAAVERMIWFYKSYQPDVESEQEGGRNRGKWYDFTQDADVLLTSFLISYNLDLHKANIHWWEFRRLMLNLPHNTPFMERVGYRTADLSKMSKEMRKYYKKMRSRYAIKNKYGPSATAEEMDNAFLERVRKRYEEAQEYAENNGP